MRKIAFSFFALLALMASAVGTPAYAAGNEKAPDRPIVAGDAETLIANGILQTEQKHYRDAINLLLKAISLAPNSFEAHWALGQAYYGARQYAEAISEYMRSVELTPDPDLRSQMYYLAGVAATKHKMYISARRYLLKAGDNPNAKDLLKRLDEEDKKRENIFNYSLFYNSNVSQAPDDISGVVGRDSMGMSALYYGRRRIHERDRQAINFSLSVYGDMNFDEQDFNVTEFSPALSLNSGDFDFSYTFSQLQVGGGLFANRNRLLGTYQAGRFVGTAEYGSTNYDQNIRDGVYFEGGLGQTILVRQQWLKWSLRVMNETARDEAFARLRVLGEARYSWPMGKTDRLAAGFLYSNSKYNEPLSPFNVKRRDKVSGGDLTYTHPLKPDTSVSVGLSYKNSHSNINLFAYNRWFGKVEVGVSF